MGDMTMWRFCPFCGGQWEPGGGVLKARLAEGRIVCGRCGVEWSAHAKPADPPAPKRYSCACGWKRTAAQFVEHRRNPTDRCGPVEEVKV